MASVSSLAPAAPQPAAGATYTGADEQNPVRKIAFLAAWMLVFIRFSLLQQFANYFAHTQLYLLYVFGVPALFGAFLSGALRRTFDRRTAYWVAGCALWFVITIPFSSWRSDSFHQVASWIRTDLPTLFLVAGLTLTWKECERMLYAVALGGCVQLLWARMFDTEGGERLGLAIGSLNNSNDYAAHMILSLGFVLWLTLHPSRSRIIRTFAFLALIFGLLLVVRTASRGALVSLFVVSLIFLYRASTTQRVALMIVAPVVLAIVLVSVPRGALVRITSFSEDSEGASEEAIMSSTARRYLLRKSIEYTFTHPLFGVGVGQFASFEGSHNKVTGEHGMWHETHNTYTQVGSETGLPGLILYVGAIFSIIGAFRRINTKAKKRPDCQDIAVASFCVMVATIGFCVCVTFLSFAYFFYFPFLGGLAVAMWRAADREFQTRIPPHVNVMQALPARNRTVYTAAEAAAVRA